MERRRLQGIEQDRRAQDPAVQAAIDSQLTEAFASDPGAFGGPPTFSF
jgi:hypothetical protein